MTTNEALALYRLERDRSKHRRAAAKQVEMAVVTKAYKARLAKDAEAGKGGRPRGTKPRHSFAMGKPGKPQINVEREQVLDLAAQLSPFFGTGR